MTTVIRAGQRSSSNLKERRHCSDDEEVALAALSRASISRHDTRFEKGGRAVFLDFALRTKRIPGLADGAPVRD